MTCDGGGAGTAGHVLDAPHNGLRFVRREVWHKCRSGRMQLQRARTTPPTKADHRAGRAEMRHRPSDSSAMSPIPVLVSVPRIRPVAGAQIRAVLTFERL